MKKLYRLALSLCVMTGLSSVAGAQAPEPPASSMQAGSQPSHDFDREQRGPHCPMGFREHQHRPGEMLRGLGLTADQHVKIKAAFEAQHEKGRANFAQMRQDRQALRATSPLDASYDQKVAAVKTDIDNRIQAKSDIKKALFRILTPAQQSKLMARMDRGPQDHGRGGPIGPEFGGPRRGGPNDFEGPGPRS